MGGHVAEKLVIGKDNISSGCGSDLQGATQLASQAVRYFGMYGDDVSFISRPKDQTSDEHNGQIDVAVQRILDESYQRVKTLLTNKDKELRDLAKNLFLHDYLDADEMDRIISGRGLDESKKVRGWDQEEYLIKF